MSQRGAADVGLLLLILILVGVVMVIAKVY